MAITKFVSGISGLNDAGKTRLDEFGIPHTVDESSEQSAITTTTTNITNPIIPDAAKQTYTTQQVQSNEIQTPDLLAPTPLATATTGTTERIAEPTQITAPQITVS